jgi:hypothetical protein
LHVRQLTVDNIKGLSSHGGGNSASYLIRRLKRDNPAVAQALARGEYKSARAAGIAAGSADGWRCAGEAGNNLDGGDGVDAAYHSDTQNSRRAGNHLDGGDGL